MKKVLVLLFACMFVVQAFAQTINVSGKITGTGDPQGIPGANVIVNGTTKGVAADIDGNYTIAVEKGQTLEFSAIGYASQNVVADGRAQIDVVLQASTTALEEAVVIGFGTQKKANLTGAVTQVKMEEVLGDRPIVNAASALQGAIPGLMVSGSSTPGQAKSFNIRGTVSINGASPLVLIDNVEGDINMINPEDIESMTVLKDAASSAIYGARAAGGVILVTTKRPNKAAKIKLNYNNNFGFETSINRPKQASLDAYLQAYQDAGFSDRYWSNSQSVTKWRQYLSDYKQNPSSFTTVGDGIYVDPAGEIYYLNEKDIYKNMLETGSMMSHNLSVSGGAENIRYRMSVGYNKENGPLYMDKDTYRRSSVSAFISTDITKWFTQEIDVRYATSTKRMPNDEVGGLYTLRLISYYPEGIMPASVNTLAKEDLPIFTPRNIIKYSNTSKTKVDNPRVFFKSILKPIKGLEIVGEYTYDKNTTNFDYYSGQWDYTTIQLSKTSAPSTDYYVKRRYFYDYNALNIYGTYSYNIKDDHHFKLMLGFNQEEKKYEYVNNRAEEMVVPSTPSFSGATGKITNYDEYSDVASRGAFFRFSYDYRERYLLTVNGRYDGSSKFPRSNRFGFFPSVEAAWRIDKEGFMESTKDWLNNLKLRVSWGQLGNQNIDPYQYTPSMGISQYTGWLVDNDYLTAIGVPSLVRNNFTWETVESFNIGLDFAMFNRRLQTTFEWYRRNTNDMLSESVELPSVVGASAPLQNYADMRTNGWEISVNWSDKIGQVGYRAGFNIYDHTSKITKIKNESKVLSSYYDGYKLGTIWGYLADGFYTVDDFESTTTWKLKDGVTSIQGYNVRPGDLKFKNLSDVDGSTNQINAGNSTLENKGDLTIVGNSTSRYQFGINLGVNYKGFDLNIMMQGVGKRDYWLGGQAMFPFGGSGASDGVFQPIYSNQTDYWKPVDADNGDYTAVKDNPKYFRIYGQMNNVGSNTRVSDKYLQNAAYLRIKNVTLSYTFQKDLLKKLYIEQLKVFCSVENLATFTSLPDGFDPESLSWSYPFYRTISFGVNITF